MAYTEIKERNSKKYYYRVKSIRKGNKISKERIYLGANLKKKELSEKEKMANEKFYRERASKKIADIKSKILRIIKKEGIKKAGIFGSYATGKQNTFSDIDILIEPPPKMGLYEIIRIEDKLRKNLKKKVDLVTYASIHRLLKDRILKEEVRIT